MLFVTPPVSDGIHGEVCCVAGGRHADMTLVPFRIVNAIRCRAAQRIRWKVVIVDFLSFLTPRLAIVFELAHEFLLLRIDALQQVGDQSQIFFSTRGRPPPGSRT